MGRSGYSDDVEPWALICWRGAVNSAIKGKRGQAFLREMLAALDALPEPRLIRDELVSSDGVCALGAVAVRRHIDVGNLDPHDRESIAKTFGIAEAMAAEIAEVNDLGRETPWTRFQRVRQWVETLIKEKE